MEPAAAKESWGKVQPLPEDDFKKLVAKRIKAYRVERDHSKTIVVVVSTYDPNPDPSENYDVITCTRPPCWPGH